MSKDARGTPSVDPEKQAHLHDDDVIVVPKGSNRTRFFLTTILVIMVLGTFTVSREVVDVLTGSGKAKNAYMKWTRPDGTVETMKQMDFLLVRQNLSRVESILSGGRSSKEKNDAQVARHIILDELAQEAGVDVPDSELRDILKGFGTSEVYRQTLSHFRTTTTEFEDALRSLLRVARYEELIGAASAIPDPKEVVDHWKASHKEFQLDAIEVPTAGFTDEATAACPKGDELKAWFEALPDAEKNTYRQQIEAKTAAEFCWFALDPMSKTDRLLQKYRARRPRTPTTSRRPGTRRTRILLYRKPDLPAGKPRTPEDILPFDDVKDSARSAGLAYQSLLDWVNDMRGREEKGEKVELSPEAIALGLAYRREDTAHTRAEWKAASMAWSGRRSRRDVLPDRAGGQGARRRRRPEGDLRRPPAREAGQPHARLRGVPGQGARRLDREEEGRARAGEARPSAREVPDRARGAEADSKTKARGPKDPASLPVVEPDAEKFKAAATELGLDVKSEDWFDAGASFKNGMPTPLVLYERQAAQSLGETTGAIAKPSLSADKSAAWIVRIAASRDPDTSKLTPQDYQTARQLASFQSRSELFEKTFGSDDYLKQRFGLDLEAWRRKDAEKGSSPDTSRPRSRRRNKPSRSRGTARHDRDRRRQVLARECSRTRLTLDGRVHRRTSPSPN
jgi:hypothetical protein